jgi:ubiquinone biosynthesis protein UbiJ
MQGEPGFAEEVRYLVRNLTWDVEEDLSKVTGDIAAHRIVAGARALRDWSADASVRVVQGAAEYWTEEQPLIASRVKLEDFARELAALEASLASLEARIARLS